VIFELIMIQDKLIFTGAYKLTPHPSAMPTPSPTGEGFLELIFAIWRAKIFINEPSPVGEGGP
jgi:hypothetical protein